MAPVDGGGNLPSPSTRALRWSRFGTTATGPELRGCRFGTPATGPRRGVVASVPMPFMHI